MTFLVTRQIFTGAGRVGAAGDAESWMQVGQLIVPRSGLGESRHRPAVPFQLSQRSDHIVNDFFEWVQHNRAIVNTRDEPLADPNHYRRIHLLLGDSNMAETATALKLGTTALVLQLIEEGHAPSDFAIFEPVEALQEISRDETRTWIIRLESGKSVSTIDIQEAFLEAAERRYRGQDDETDWILDQWGAILKDLRGDYTALVGRVDWASKLWLLESFREAEQLDWTDPTLKSLDLEYHNLNAGKGLYFGLLDEGRVPRVITSQAIALAQDHPPRNTRAFGRGELVRHLLDCPPSRTPAEPQEDRLRPEGFFPPYIINWSAFQLRGHPPFLMADPFKTYAQQVRDHLLTREA